MCSGAYALGSERHTRVIGNGQHRIPCTVARIGCAKHRRNELQRWDDGNGRRKSRLGVFSHSVCSRTGGRFRMLYAVSIHSRMPTLCKIAAWPYQCLLTQNADRCSRAAGTLARARLLVVDAMIIRGDGPNQLCESIEPISARERCLKNNAPPASRLLRCSCAGRCPRQVTAAHVERPSAWYRPGRSPGGARARWTPRRTQRFSTSSAWCKRASRARRHRLSARPA